MNVKILALGFYLMMIMIIMIEGKSITLTNAVIQGNVNGSYYSVSEVTMNDVMRQLYQETMLRFEIEKKLQFLTEKVSKLEKTRNVTMVTNINEKVENRSGLGFYAYLSGDLANPGGSQTLVYNIVRTNFDNAYNEHTGVFTSPVDGMFSFTWVTRVECSQAYTSELHVNKEVVGSTYAYCGYNSVAGNAIVNISKGSVVFVRTLAGQGMIRSNQHGRTSFSGFLIK